MMDNLRVGWIGLVQFKMIFTEIRWKGNLLIFENVPVGVCKQCGEKVIKPEVAKAIDQLLQDEKKPAKIIQVPVYQYEPNIA